MLFFPRSWKYVPVYGRLFFLAKLQIVYQNKRNLPERSDLMPVNLYYFLFFYVITYMGNAVYSTFIPVYFLNIGFSPSQIGTLLSLGPLVAILAQPVWGALGDRARTKKTGSCKY